MESDSSATDDHQPAQSPPVASSSSSSSSTKTTTTTASPKTKTRNGFYGKHRMAAAISNLQNQINFLQDELDQLETLGESSIVCEGLISSVESVPDPLLPLSKGPINVSWERWFLGASYNSRKRWI